MRQGSNPRRSRGRGPRKPHNPSRPQNFDSPGPDVRVRGNTYQVMEKYLALARDASLAGDRIAMENYLQHAEHYYRTINSNGDANRPRPPMRNDGQGGGDGGQGGNSQGGNTQGGNTQGGNGPAGDGAGGNGFDGQSEGNSRDGEETQGQSHEQHQPQSPAKATAVVEPTEDSES
jgi:uncharacterized protein DUF4167